VEGIVRANLKNRTTLFVSALLSLTLFILSIESEGAPIVRSLTNTNGQYQTNLEFGQGSNKSLKLISEFKKIREPLQDANAIIRSLAPYQNLPGDGAQKQSVDLDIPFDLNKATLKPSAISQLDELANALKSDELSKSMFLIAGHTDASGAAEYNKILSEKRAEAVLQILVKKYNFDPARLKSRGYGEEKLKNPIVPEAAVNRRVEIVRFVFESEGVNIKNKKANSNKIGQARIKIEW